MQERSVRIDHHPDHGGPVDLVVLEAGAGGRPLLMVHGFTGAKEDFADHADALAERGWWVVAPDLRGHGSSTKPTEEHHYSLDHYADDLWALVDSLGWERLALLGHSMGGMAAQVAALRHPERLDGLVLMNTSHGPIEDVDRDMAALGQAVVREGGIEAVKAALDAMGDDAPLGSEAFQRVRRERPGYQEFSDRKFLASSPAMYASMLVQLLDQEDRIDDLSRLDVETLVIVGDQDQSFLGPSARMVESLPRAHHAVVPDAGHSPQFEHPEAWFAAIVGFLDTLVGEAAP